MRCRSLTGSSRFRCATSHRLVRPFIVSAASMRYVAHIVSVLDAASIERAAVCGISFGGLIALRVAATMPARVSALVLASTPGPQFHLKKRHRLYARMPWLFGPLFAAESPSRLRMRSEGRVARRNGAPRIHAPADADVSRSAALGVPHGDKGTADRVVRSGNGLRARSHARRWSFTESRHSISWSTQTERPTTVTSLLVLASPSSSTPGISDRSRSRGALPISSAPFSTA